MSRGTERVHGSQEKRNNLRQMMALMCQKPAPKGVIFCITKCTQVPPITMDHIDMGAVMKLFSSLRAEVKLLSSSNMRIDERLTRIERERESVPIEEVINDNGKDGLSAQEVIDLQARLLKKFRPPMEKKGKSFSEALKVKPRHHSPPVEPLQSTSMPKHSESDTSSSEENSDDKEKEDGFQLQRWQKKKQKRYMMKDSMENIRRSKSRGLARKGIVIGSNEGTGLQAAEPMTNLSLFVSRLRPSVEEETLKLHIKTISSNDKVTCEKLQVKH